MTAALALLVSLLTPFTPAYAATDAERHAQMEVSYASGFYEPTRGAVLSVEYADGNPSALVLTAHGRKLTAQVWNVQYSGCGDRINARINIPDDRTATDVFLIDYSNVTCRLYVKNKWHATVTTLEPNGTKSTLRLEGNPEN